MSEWEGAIRAIAERVRAKHEDVRTCLDTQVLCLAEEVGEAVQAYRRATGRARSTAPWSAVAEELADVVIVAYVTAEITGIDLDTAIKTKLAAIEARGGV
jgi:NTP pyrophosphatase (non-canonical NTP hydrolase)